MTKTAAQQTVELALGRIFGMMQRPYQAGDEIEYARCKNIILDHTERMPDDTEPCFARDYHAIVMSGQ